MGASVLILTLAIMATWVSILLWMENTRERFRKMEERLSSRISSLKDQYDTCHMRLSNLETMISVLSARKQPSASQEKDQGAASSETAER